MLLHSIIVFPLILKSFFSPDISQDLLTIEIERYNIKIYFPQELSPVARIFASETYKQNELIKDIVGLEAKDFSIFIGFESDGFYFERFFTHSKLIFVNWGGTRIDEKLSGISISYKVRQILLASLFGSENFYIIRPDFFIRPELIHSFSEFGEIDDKIFINYPFSFLFSENSRVIKYIELFYGKRKVFELFINGKILFESQSKYYQEFKKWEESRLEIIRETVKRNYEGINLYPDKSFDFPSRGVHLRHNEVITVLEDGKIFSSKSGNIFQRRGGKYLNGDGKFLVLDSKNEENGLFYTFIITPSQKVFRLPQKRAWFPDIFSREDGTGFILFIRKNLSYDEMCISDFVFTDQKFQFGEISCPLKSAELEEFFTPDISPDGKKVAFSYLRKNGFLDIAVFDIEDKTLLSITQDNQPDFSPSFTQDGKILFTSFREGRYLLYLYDNEKFLKVSENPEGILEGKIYNGKIYSIFIEDGKTYLGTHQISELGNINFQKARLSFVGTEFESSKVKSIQNLNILRLLPPRVFADSSGFLALSLYLLLTDNIYRTPIFLNFSFSSNINLYEQAERLKFIKFSQNSNSPQISNMEELKSGETLLRGFGFSIFSFVRSFSPHIFLRVSSYPFSGIFVRQIIQDENKQNFFFIPETQLSGDIYLFQKSADKFWFLFGGKLGSIYPEKDSIPELDTSFWNFVKEEYKKLGYGKFFQVESGLYMNSTYKTFSPQDGFDGRLFLGIQSFFEKDRSPLSPYSNFSFSYFTPSFNFFSFPMVGLLNFNGFISYPHHNRFKTSFGSKSIPFYFDPADNFSPLWKPGAIPFFPENLKYDVGLIRGVKVRDGKIGAVAKISPILNLFSSISEPKYVLDIDYINLSPFFSWGGLIDSKNLQNFLSYGSELKIKSKIFFLIPFDFISGFAKGEITEFYFLIFLSP